MPLETDAPCTSVARDWCCRIFLILIPQEVSYGWVGECVCLTVSDFNSGYIILFENELKSLHNKIELKIHESWKKVLPTFRYFKY